MDALTFLEKAAKSKPEPVYILTGDEDFLKRQALLAIKKLVLGTGDDSFGLSAYPGEQAHFATVRSELETLPFLAARRLVVIDNADPFVTAYRTSLEKYVSQPAKAGVLVLDVKSWTATTRLAKMVSDSGTIVCKTPSAQGLPGWCVRWAGSEHGKQLSHPAAQLLLQLVGSEMGVLNQELAKLATYVGKAARIDVDDVDLLVGRSRAADTFKILDAIAAGKPGDALGILDQLFTQGEDARGILAPLAWQLRRLAQAGRLIQQGLSLPAALDGIGVQSTWSWMRKSYEQQLRHLGIRRTAQLYDWVLETDFGMKGASALPPRVQLERLLVRLAKKG